MLVSVIICTYRRAEDLRKLVACLAAQTYRDFEVVVVDGSGEDSTVRDAVRKIADSAGGALDLRWIPSPQGLTRQRNVGLRESRGDVVCFFDDDVTIAEGFLAQVVELFQRPGFEDVGGIGGRSVFDEPAEITWRWRARRWLRAIPKLVPGQVDCFGRSVPVGFMASFSGCRPTGYLPGFCMIYRRAAVGRLVFDEELPTYGGEDRDFSMEVGRQWRLFLCGDLQVEHHRSATNRVEGARQVRESAFGMGRSFAKRATWPWGSLLVVQYLLVELLFDLAALVGHPSLRRLAMPPARAAGVVAGFRSVRRHGLQRWTDHEHDLANAS